jgi:hypothetical protein
MSEEELEPLLSLTHNYINMPGRGFELKHLVQRNRTQRTLNIQIVSAFNRYSAEAVPSNGCISNRFRLQFLLV